METHTRQRYAFIGACVSPASVSQASTTPPLFPPHLKVKRRLDSENYVVVFARDGKESTIHIDYLSAIGIFPFKESNRVLVKWCDGSESEDENEGSGYETFTGTVVKKLGDNTYRVHFMFSPIVHLLHDTPTS